MSSSTNLQSPGHISMPSIPSLRQLAPKPPLDPIKLLLHSCFRSSTIPENQTNHLDPSFTPDVNKGYKAQKRPKVSEDLRREVLQKGKRKADKLARPLPETIQTCQAMKHQKEDQRKQAETPVPSGYAAATPQEVARSEGDGIDGTPLFTPRHKRRKCSSPSSKDSTGFMSEGKYPRSYQPVTGLTDELDYPSKGGRIKTQRGGELRQALKGLPSYREYTNLVIGCHISSGTVGFPLQRSSSAMGERHKKLLGFVGRSILLPATSQYKPCRSNQIPSNILSISEDHRKRLLQLGILSQKEATSSRSRSNFPTSRKKIQYHAFGIQCRTS